MVGQQSSFDQGRQELRLRPVPWLDPNPLPVIVMVVPAPPDSGVTVEIVGDATAKAVEFDHTPDRCTCAVPVVDPAATVAMICVSLQLTTFALVLPSQAMLVPCVDPNPVPEIVTCVPGTPLVGVTVRTRAGIT